MFGIWRFLRQFIGVVDEDIKVRDWADVTWTITTPINDLDVASPGSKMGLDATNQWPGKTNREWGRTIQMTPEVTAKIGQMRQTLGL